MALACHMIGSEKPLTESAGLKALDDMSIFREDPSVLAEDFLVMQLSKRSSGDCRLLRSPAKLLQIGLGPWSIHAGQILPSHRNTSPDSHGRTESGELQR